MAKHHHEHYHAMSRVRKIQRIYYGVACALGILICYLVIVSIALGQTRVVSGIVRDENAQYANNSGTGGRAPNPPNPWACPQSVTCTEVYTIVLLDGDNTQYRVVWSDFPSTQSQVSTVAGDHLRLWYTQAPFFGTDVVALQQLGSNGPVGPFVASRDYFDPTGRAFQMFPLIAILLVLVCVLVLTARTAPSRAGKARQSSGLARRLAQPWMR